MFHSGKMTTGTGLPDLGFDHHFTNQQADNLKFNAIRLVAQSIQKLKNIKIWLTLMTLNRELGDRFDFFDGQHRWHILRAENCYTLNSLICEADVLQFHGETNDRFGYFDVDQLGHQQGCISITQDLENFYTALMCKNSRKEFNTLLRNDLNMFHFEKLLNWQRYLQKIWLQKEMLNLKKRIFHEGEACFHVVY